MKSKEKQLIHGEIQSKGTFKIEVSVHLSIFIIKVRVRINVSWFGKYDAFFIFHNTVFPTYPENHDTKKGFCFIHWGTKTKFFFAVKVKNDFNMMRISFLLKQLSCCCLDIRFFPLTLIGVSFCNSFPLYVLFLPVHCYTEYCFAITERCFKSVYY